MNECTPKEDIHMLRGKGRIVDRPGYSKEKKYPKIFLYIPVDIVKDSAFPFQVGEVVDVIIDAKNRRLVIEKVSFQGEEESKK